MQVMFHGRDATAGLTIEIGELTQRCNTLSRHGDAVIIVTVLPLARSRFRPLRPLKRGCHAENVEVLVHYLD